MLEFIRSIIEAVLGRGNSMCKGLGAKDRTSGNFKCLSMHGFGSRVQVINVKEEVNRAGLGSVLKDMLRYLHFLQRGKLE